MSFVTTQSRTPALPAEPSLRFLSWQPPRIQISYYNLVTDFSLKAQRCSKQKQRTKAHVLQEQLLLYLKHLRDVALKVIEWWHTTRLFLR